LIYILDLAYDLLKLLIFDEDLLRKKQSKRSVAGAGIINGLINNDIFK